MLSIGGRGRATACAGCGPGADEYVGKPYDAGYVVARARELLRARRRPAGAADRRLVIDDSVTFREELRDALEPAGYAVLTAADRRGGPARGRPSSARDAVVVDGVLPGIDGATVIRRLRLDAALRDMPCLLLTASDGPRRRAARARRRRRRVRAQGGGPRRHPGQAGGGAAADATGAAARRRRDAQPARAARRSWRSTTASPTCTSWPTRCGARATTWCWRAPARRRWSCSRCSPSTASCSTCHAGPRRRGDLPADQGGAGRARHPADHAHRARGRARR